MKLEKWPSKSRSARMPKAQFNTDEQKISIYASVFME